MLSVIDYADYQRVLRPGGRATYRTGSLPVQDVDTGLVLQVLEPTCIERSKSISMEAHMISGAYHSFDSPQITHIRPDAFGNQMLYDPGATEKARALVGGFLERSLK